MNSPNSATHIASPTIVRSDTPLRYTPSPATPDEQIAGRMERMELGLSEIRTALDALKSTCAVLEMQADKLGSEIAGLKGLVSPAHLNRPSTAIQHLAPAVPKATPSHEDLATHGLITPPSTPLSRPLATPQIVQPEVKPPNALCSPTLSGILGKRRFSASECDPIRNQSSIARRGPDEPSPKRRIFKRVRFADAEIMDPPMPNAPTPESYHLDLPTEVESVTLAPPLLEASSGLVVSEEPEVKPTKTELGPEIISFAMGGTYHRGLSRRITRRKTRWDPHTGRRIPIPALQAVVEKVKSDKNYEHHLSETMSNTSLA